MQMPLFRPRSGGLPPMNRMQKTLILSGCLLSLCSSGALQPALAERSSQVQFKPGRYGAMVSGTVSGRE